VYGKIKQISEKLWKRRHFGRPQPPEIVLERQRRTIFGQGTTPFHSHAPILTHVVSLLLHLSLFPTGSDYTHFAKGLLLAGVLWERRRSQIRREMDQLSALLSQPGAPSAPATKQLSAKETDDPLDNDAALASNLCSLISQGIGHGVFPQHNDLLNTVVFGMMVNRDTKIDHLQMELKERRNQNAALKNEIKQLKEKNALKIAAHKNKLEAIREQNISLKQELTQLKAKNASPFGRFKKKFSTFFRK
jgi:hypothetical protein